MRIIKAERLVVKGDTFNRLDLKEEILKQFELSVDDLPVCIEPRFGDISNCNFRGVTVLSIDSTIEDMNILGGRMAFIFWKEDYSYAGVQKLVGDITVGNLCGVVEQQHRFIEANAEAISKGEFKGKTISINTVV